MRAFHMVSRPLVPAVQPPVASPESGRLDHDNAVFPHLQDYAFVMDFHWSKQHGLTLWGEFMTVDPAVGL